jgi:hypothetical protein
MYLQQLVLVQVVTGKVDVIKEVNPQAGDIPPPRDPPVPEGAVEAEGANHASKEGVIRPGW